MRGDGLTIESAEHVPGEAGCVLGCRHMWTGEPWYIRASQRLTGMLHPWSRALPAIQLVYCGICKHMLMIERHHSGVHGRVQALTAQHTS